MRLQRYLMKSIQAQDHFSTFSLFSYLLLLRMRMDLFSVPCLEHALSPSYCVINYAFNISRNRIHH